MPTERHQFVRVEFSRFKAFKNFSIGLRHFNILVGPNNAGKSTILAAFRILEAAMRTARRQKAVPVMAFKRPTLGHSVDIRAISVAEENIFHNYDDSEPATVKFHLSNRNTLTLYFPESGACLLLMDAQGRSTATPASFKSQFNCPIGFVPILGPVEHHEQLYQKETARRSLFTYNAARNFRNIWFHYPENFDAFRSLLQLTWPGMDIQVPEIDRSHEKPRLHMYCPEGRYPREIFWAGFGFQVWIQMLTHLVKSSEVSLFLIDEPDIYLHSELQRQLLGLLRNLGPDVMLATHSTEIITEAEAARKVADRAIRSGRPLSYQPQAADTLNIFAAERKAYITSQMVTARRHFERARSPTLDEATITQASLEDVELRWSSDDTKFDLVPGKEALAAINSRLQEGYGVTVTPTAIVDAMLEQEVPQEILTLVQMLSDFAAMSLTAEES